MKYAPLEYKTSLRQFEYHSIRSMRVFLNIFITLETMETSWSSSTRKRTLTNVPLAVITAESEIETLYRGLFDVSEYNNPDSDLLKRMKELISASLDTLQLNSSTLRARSWDIKSPLPTLFST